MFLFVRVLGLPSHLDAPVPIAHSSTDPERFGGLDGFFAARFRKA